MSKLDMIANPHNAFRDYAEQLEQAEKHPLCEHEQWLGKAPAENGIYAVWSKVENTTECLYVGEASNLNHRLFDLTRKRRHRMAKFVVDATKLMSWLQLKLGRKELEEFLILDWKPRENHQPKRAILKNQIP